MDEVDEMEVDDGQDVEQEGTSDTSSLKGPRHRNNNVEWVHAAFDASDLCIYCGKHLMRKTSIRKRVRTVLLPSFNLTLH